MFSLLMLGGDACLSSTAFSEVSSQNPKPSITLCMCTINDIEVYIIPAILQCHTCVCSTECSKYYNIIIYYAECIPCIGVAAQLARSRGLDLRAAHSTYYSDHPTAPFATAVLVVGRW